MLHFSLEDILTLDLFHSDAYRALMREHIYNVLVFLLEGGQEFAVAAEVEHVSMEPELPRNITKSFGEVALFVISGYTFESAYVDEERLYFEAGFGEENIGTIASVPLLAVRQIFVGEYPILINITSPVPFEQPSDKKNRSMEALLNNPENQKLIKTAKKHSNQPKN
jgi:hypothetical protein